MGLKTKMGIACDHAGFDLKEELKARFDDRIDWVDFGTDSTDSVDYPDYGKALGQAITNGSIEQGVAICGSGIGISIALNRFPAVRAAVCVMPEMARLTRVDNDANVISLGARIIDLETAVACLETFLNTDFAGKEEPEGRHARRVKKLSE